MVIRYIFQISLIEIKYALRMLGRVEVGWMLIVIFAHSTNLLNSILLSYSFYFNAMFHLKTSSPNIPQTKIHIITFWQLCQQFRISTLQNGQVKFYFALQGSVKWWVWSSFLDENPASNLAILPSRPPWQLLGPSPKKTCSKRATRSGKDRTMADSRIR